MPRSKTAIAGLCLMLALAATPANAAKMMFGTSETVNKIRDLQSKGPNGEALFLGYKLSRYSFLAPLYMTDDGYVIGIAGTDRFLPLDAASIADFQKSGDLPNPLPTYDIPLFEYVFGYLLWVILPFIGLWYYLEGIWKRRKAAKLAAAAAVVAGPAHFDSPPPADPSGASAAVSGTEAAKAASDIGQIRPGAPGQR